MAGHKSEWQNGRICCNKNSIPMYNAVFSLTHSYPYQPKLLLVKYISRYERVKMTDNFVGQICVVGIEKDGNVKFNIEKLVVYLV